MKVILTQHIQKLGKIGDIVSTSNGHAKNWLIPQGLAIRASEQNIAKLTSLQAELQAKDIQQKNYAQKTAQLLEGKHLTFIVQSTTDNKLFGSITNKALAKEISKFTKNIVNYNNIILNNPIKFNGIYNIGVMLHPEITSHILVIVAKTESEAQDMLTEHKQAIDKTDNSLS
jgi:large subunit ribosomal protein L9